MPVEIRELVIRATVDAAGEDARDDDEGAATPPQLQLQQAELVAAAVREVLRILKAKEER